MKETGLQNFPKIHNNLFMFKLNESVFGAGGSEPGIIFS